MIEKRNLKVVLDSIQIAHKRTERAKLLLLKHEKEEALEDLKASTTAEVKAIRSSVRYLDHVIELGHEFQDVDCALMRTDTTKFWVRLDTYEVVSDRIALTPDDRQVELPMFEGARS